MRFNLKNFRQSHGLFQSEMAALLGVNQSNVSRAEIKGWFELSFPQQKALYEKYGKDDVDAFAVDDDKAPESAKASGEEGNGGLAATGSAAIEIIKAQSDALAELAAKQSQQTDRLIALLEKLSERI